MPFLRAVLFLCQFQNESFWLDQTLTEMETKETITYHKLHLTLPVPIIRPE